jgi:hypothetical protein
MGVNLKILGCTIACGDDVLAITDAERMKKPKLPKKRFLKKTVKRKRGR